MFQINIPPNHSEPIRVNVGSTRFELVFDRNKEIVAHPEIAYITELRIRNAINKVWADLYVGYGRNEEFAKVDFLLPWETLTLPTAPDKIWMKTDFGDINVVMYYDYYTVDLIYMVKEMNKDIMKDAILEILPQVDLINKRKYKYIKDYIFSDNSIVKFIKRFKKYPGGKQ